MEKDANSKKFIHLFAVTKIIDFTQEIKEAQSFSKSTSHNESSTHPICYK